MDDFIQIMVYVAFLLIYLVSKAVRNKNTKPATRLPKSEAERHPSSWNIPDRRPEVSQKQGRSGMDEPKRKPGTFEEIFRELTGADQWEEQARRREEESERAYERQQQAARQEAREIEAKVEKKAETYSKKLGDSVKQAKRAKRVHDKNLKEIDRLVEPIKAKKKYQRKPGLTIGQEIGRSLQDPQSARKAIILGEIINRKYF